MSYPIAPDVWWLQAIAWAYLVTNALRVVTYVPQILAVWRCRDGAQSLSLLTWGSWTISNLTALLYGAIVAGDAMLVMVSTINFVCCTTVVVIASRRRMQWSQLHLSR